MDNQEPWVNNELEDMPYGDMLYVKPVEKQLVVGGKTLQTYGTVLAKGKDALNTDLGDIVAFELQDKPEFIAADGTVYNFVREKDCMTKLPKSFL